MNRDQPKVSVVVAAYNVSHCIEKSLQSLCRQTLEEIEILVYDDASTDDTACRVACMAVEDNRIILIRGEENQGQAYARNQCFQAARGQYIAIHDGDDLSRPHRLQTQADFLDTHPQYDIVGACVTVFYDGGATARNPRGIPGEITPRHFLWGMPLCHPATMYRRKALEAVGGYRVEADTFRRNEDYDMLMAMYAAGMKAYALEEPLYLYYEGKDAYRRRLFAYRLAEMRIRLRGFKALGLMPAGLLFAVKPVLVGLIPQMAVYAVRRSIQ